MVNLKVTMELHHVSTLSQNHKRFSDQNDPGHLNMANDVGEAWGKREIQMKDQGFGELKERTRRKIGNEGIRSKKRRERPPVEESYKNGRIKWIQSENTAIIKIENEEMASWYPKSVE